MKIDFYNYNKNNWGELQKKVSNALVDCLAQNKSFYVEFCDLKEPKTHDQLKGIYKLFQKALPHFEKWRPAENWDLEKIKEYSKAHLGYQREPSDFEVNIMIKSSGFAPKDDAEKQKMINFCKKIKQNISFADFTKAQLTNFIKEFEVMCHERGWIDVFLENNN